MGIEIIKIETGEPKRIASDRVHTVDVFKPGEIYTFTASNHLSVRDRKLVVTLPLIGTFRVWFPPKIEVV